MGLDQLILESIHKLPPDKQSEVLDFVEFLASRVDSAAQTKKAFPSLKDFRASMKPAVTSASELLQQMRDEEDGRCCSGGSTQ